MSATEQNTFRVHILVGLDVVQDRFLVVKGAVSLSERAALSQGNANARSLDDRARGSEEGKSHRDERRLAEHCVEAGEGWRRAGSRDLLGSQGDLRGA
jgi:hypothetical protein